MHPSSQHATPQRLNSVLYYAKERTTSLPHVDLGEEQTESCAITASETSNSHQRRHKPNPAEQPLSQPQLGRTPTPLLVRSEAREEVPVFSKDPQPKPFIVSWLRFCRPKKKKLAPTPVAEQASTHLASSTQVSRSPARPSNSNDGEVVFEYPRSSEAEQSVGSLVARQVTELWSTQSTRGSTELDVGFSKRLHDSRGGNTNEGTGDIPYKTNSRSSESAPVRSPANIAARLEMDGESFRASLDEVQQTLEQEPPRYQITGPDSQTTQPPSEPFESQSPWGRFPSHTRAERSGSAGAGDGVVPRDFAQSVSSQGPPTPTESQILKTPVFPIRTAATRIQILPRKIGRKLKFSLRRLFPAQIASSTKPKWQRGDKEKRRVFGHGDGMGQTESSTDSGSQTVPYGSPGRTQFRARARISSSVIGLAPTTISSARPTRHNSSSGTTDEYRTASSGISPRHSDSLSFRSAAYANRPSRDGLVERNAEGPSEKSALTMVRRSRFRELVANTLVQEASTTHRGGEGLEIVRESTAPVLEGNNSALQGQDFMHGTNVCEVAALG